MPTRTLSARRLALATAAIAAQAACSSPQQGSSAQQVVTRSATVADQPRAADRYATLLRRILSDSNPMAVQQLMSCEAARISAAFGTDEAGRRIRAVRDTVFRTHADTVRFSQVEDSLAGHSFEVGGPFCDSVNAVTARELPLKPTADSAR